MFRGPRRSLNNMFVKLIKKVFNSFNKDNYSTLSIIENFIDKEKFISNLNIDNGQCYTPCSFKSGIYVGTKECCNCKHCYGIEIKILTTYKQTIKAYCIVKCNYTRNIIYRLFTRYIIRTYNILTNKMVNYKMILIY